MPGATRILKWKDGRRAVFMLEFDDSAPTQLEFVIPALRNHGFPGTFYINPGNGPYKNHQSAWEQAAGYPGIELANHTYSHIGAPGLADFEHEVSRANDAIDLLYPQRKRPRLRSWARPGVPDDQWGIGEAEIRSVLARHHLVERPPFCGPPFTLRTSGEMFALVDAAIAEGEMRHLVFHGVGGDWHSTSLNDFLSLLDKLADCSGDLWLTDPLSWHKYEAERTTATLDVIAATPSALRLSLASSCDPYFYDQPLSLATRVPLSWSCVSISRGKTRIVCQARNGKVCYEAVPGAGEILLQPAPSPIRSMPPHP